MRRRWDLIFFCDHDDGDDVVDDNDNDGDVGVMSRRWDLIFCCGHDDGDNTDVESPFNH